MDLVSVIIPSYGKNTNPQRAIDSVFAQTYQNVEVIFVDDNGVGTEQQITNQKVLSQLYHNKKFVYIAHEINRGGSAARNTGALNSSGEYVCFLDDDDFFSDCQKIEKQMNVAVSLDNSYAGTFSSLRIYKNDKLTEEIKASDSGNVLVNFIRGKLSIGTAAPIIKKSIFKEIHGFDESYTRHQDWEFFSRLLDAFKLKAVPTAYYDRCYKNVPKIPPQKRKEYLDKYSNNMKQLLKSLSIKQIERLMKEKYIALYFSCVRAKQRNIASTIIHENHFHPNDYFKMLVFAIGYFFRKITKKV